MNKFGTIKSKVLQALSESYTKQDKKQLKEIITTIKKDSNFKEMYLFYEEFENKYIEDPEDAATYLEEIRSILYDKPALIKETCKALDEKIGDVQIIENELYSNLDAFIDPRKLQNIDKRIVAKKKLIEYLTTKKETPIVESTTFTGNENLLHAVLVNNFNALYGNTLDEGEKTELETILSIPEKDLKNGFDVLKEQTSSKIAKMILKEQNADVVKKLLETDDEMLKMASTRLNYYKLLKLNNGL
jgi:hypothetical protein